MGNWSMNIHGHGIHDNGLADDADSLLRKFVADLRRLGHVVHGAHITTGASQDVTEAASPEAAAPAGEPAAPAAEAPVPEPASADPAS